MIVEEKRDPPMDPALMDDLRTRALWCSVILDAVKTARKPLPKGRNLNEQTAWILDDRRWLKGRDSAMLCSALDIRHDVVRSSIALV